MKQMRSRHLCLLLAIGGLAAILLLLQNGTPQTASTAPAALFASSGGTDTECTQEKPCTLQMALSRANEEDSIYLAQGNYTGTGAAVITITKKINLYGGWDGTTATPVVRNPAAFPSTLDGQGQRRVVGVALDAKVILDGLTVTNGKGVAEGAGIYAKGANLTISNTTVYSNVADLGTVTRGGGAYLESSVLKVISSKFQANKSLGSDAGYGGGLSVFGAITTTIDNGQFLNNEAWIGGGLFTESGPVLIRRSDFRNGWSGYGGAVFFSATAGQVEESTFADNRGGNDGGALYVTDSPLVVNRSLLTGNWSLDGAAGIFLAGFSPFTMTNNIVADNWTVFGYGVVTFSGGAIHIQSHGTGLLRHNTFARNVGDNGGYGLRIADSEASISLINNIVVSHTVGISATNGSTALETTLWGTGDWANGTDWISGGGTITTTGNLSGNPAFRDPASEDYHISGGSAAINAGIDAGVATDFDGEARFAAPDIGADEYIARVYLPAVLRSYAEGW